MSRRIDRRKQSFANIVRFVIGLLLTVFCSTVIVRYVIRSSNVLDAVVVTKADSQNPDVLAVQKIIMDVENGDGDSAVEKIDALGENFSERAVLEYLTNFKNYYRRQTAKTKIDKKIESLSTLYFVQRSVDLKEFFERNKVQNVIHYLEVIPYFCIKYFEQGKNQNQKKNNASNLELYEKYISTFIEAGSIFISSTEADIICLYITTKKKSSGNSDVEVMQIQKEIEKIQNDYAAQLGENGTCVRQRDALEKMHNWCVEKIKRHFLSDLFLGFFPGYTIPIEKK